MRREMTHRRRGGGRRERPPGRDPVRGARSTRGSGAVLAVDEHSEPIPVRPSLSKPPCYRPRLRTVTAIPVPASAIATARNAAESAQLVPESIRPASPVRGGAIVPPPDGAGAAAPPVWGSAR